ncbi:hypothetical protein QVD17_14856 [Tagetes erecta]|uniref:DUF7138 domain-containing protein n=1 Tax=Tagetes erecta TaxID=13708 RepID=A0AAD8KNL0_TARER|nr:hypothetical protein QVD17_14856 [Tagetes erecta]
MVKADDDSPETTTFPVVLYDGVRQTNVGNIEIHPDLVYKAFQIKLSQIIGISYNNLTTYLVDSLKPKTSPERRKILITGKVNFAGIARETNCYFFVVLKRSRRDRRRKPGKQSDLDVHDSNDAQFAYNPYYYDDRFHDMLMQRETYMNMFGFGSVLNSSFPKIEDVYPRVQSKPNRSLCEDCVRSQKQGKTPEFHLCVYDEVFDGVFRSPAGPIRRER